MLDVTITPELTRTARAAGPAPVVCTIFPLVMDSAAMIQKAPLTTGLYPVPVGDGLHTMEEVYRRERSELTRGGVDGLITLELQ